MKIKLLGREIELIKQKEDDVFNPVYQGRCYYKDCTAYIGTNACIPMRTIIHELSHFFQYFTGAEYERKLDCEDQAQFHAAFVEALIHENGADVFVKLEKWWKGEDEVSMMIED